MKKETNHHITNHDYFHWLICLLSINVHQPDLAANKNAGYALSNEHIRLNHFADSINGKSLFQNIKVFFVLHKFTTNLLPIIIIRSFGIIVCRDSCNYMTDPT